MNGGEGLDGWMGLTRHDGWQRTESDSGGESSLMSRSYARKGRRREEPRGGRVGGSCVSVG